MSPLSQGLLAFALDPTRAVDRPLCDVSAQNSICALLVRSSPLAQIGQALACRLPSVGYLTLVGCRHDRHDHSPFPRAMPSPRQAGWTFLLLRSGGGSGTFGLSGRERKCTDSRIRLPAK